MCVQVFAVLSPGANSVLAQFHLKFGNPVWLVALYCPDLVHVTVKMAAVNNVPSVLAKVMVTRTATPAADNDLE
jgi:hypothetical protein